MGRNSHFGDIYLKVEPLGFPDRLHMDYERDFLSDNRKDGVAISRDGEDPKCAVSRERSGVQFGAY